MARMAQRQGSVLVARSSVGNPFFIFFSVWLFSREERGGGNTRWTLFQQQQRWYSRRAQQSGENWDFLRPSYCDIVETTIWNSTLPAYAAGCLTSQSPSRHAGKTHKDHTSSNGRLFIFRRCISSGILGN